MSIHFDDLLVHCRAYVAIHMHPETLLRFEREVARRSEPRP